jgi:hypothetical protein
MAALWADHFGQYYNNADMLQGCWAEVDNGWALSTANPPRAGATHLRAALNTNGFMRRTLLAPKTVAGLATRSYLDQLPVEEPETNNWPAGVFIRSWRNGVNNTQLWTVIGTDGAISIYTGTVWDGVSFGGNWAAARLYRSLPCILPKVYHHIEDRITVGAGSGGNYELRVDGVTRINVGGINTDPRGTGDVSQLAFGPAYALGSHNPLVTLDVADVHAWDDLAGEGPVDFVGNCAVLQRLLNQDTADADWAITGGATAFGVLIDKNAATYIQAGSIGQKTGCLAAAAPVGTIPVYQQLSFRGLKTDGSDCDVAPGFKVSGAEAELPGQPMQMGEVWHWGIQATDPATSGAPFSEAEMNATEFTFTRTL